MTIVLFNKKVKYNGKFYPANTEFGVEDKDLDEATGGPTESIDSQDLTFEGYGSDKNLD